MGQKRDYVILGAGVIGLTIAHELKQHSPDWNVIIVASHLPGDRSKHYTSPWAGANWLPMSVDNGVEEERDAVTYRKFVELAAQDSHVSGVYPMDIRAVFDQPEEEAGLYSKDTNQIWYRGLVPGGLRYLPAELLPENTCFGFDMATFIIDTQKYLAWLQVRALEKGVDLRRGSYDSLSELMTDYPGAYAYFNCTGLGSRRLADVQDFAVYPQRGQVLLVENPKKKIDKMYFRGPARWDPAATYIFPRGPHGGVILGGCRQSNNWDGEVDFELAEEIKRKCCDLCPDLGKPEDLKVIHHGVGLRPAREGGARVEKVEIANSTVVHAYGVAGAGYQCSWGLAKEAVDLVDPLSRL